MSEIGYLLAAVLAKMFDPLLLAAGVIPALINRRAATVVIAAVLGASLGLFVYIMSAEGGRSVSLIVVPICASVSVIWWSIAIALRRLVASRAAKTRS